MRLSQNVELLQINTEQGKASIVLTWDESNLVLIDSGFPGQTSAIAGAISNAGFRAEALTHIILTHQDWDHIGCIMDLQRIVPNLKVIAHEKEAPYIDGRRTPIKLAARLERHDSLSEKQLEYYKNQKLFYESQRIIIAQTLRHGDIIQICGGIEVVHTPGHTPGHIALYLRQSRIMVCGDAAKVKDGQLLSIQSSSHYNPELAAITFEKLRACDMSGIVAYHGGYLAKNEME